MSTKRILIADDETHVTHVVGAKLRKCGYEVLVASDGEEALKMAQEHLPDLIITDLQMPYLSGFEIALRLMERPETSGTPVMLLTARGYVLDSTELASTNIKAVMAKPFSVTSLLASVEQLLGSTIEQRGAA